MLLHSRRKEQGCKCREIKLRLVLRNCRKNTKISWMKSKIQSMFSKNLVNSKRFPSREMNYLSIRIFCQNNKPQSKTLSPSKCKK